MLRQAARRGFASPGCSDFCGSSSSLTELRRARFDGTDYERTPFTESAYLSVHGEHIARLYYAANDAPTLTSGHLHVLLELQDHLGSSSVVVDVATSELVEGSTYQAYGAAESDYRPARWDAYRDDRRFTGKEEDVEVGLTYFGKRFLAPLLGRWASADPKSVHELEADPNHYAYVNGSALKATDPFGLEVVGYVYRIRWTDDQGRHWQYTGQAGDLKDRLEKGGHKWDKVIRARNTEITALEVDATLDVKNSGRGTVRSARREALGSVEQKDMVRRSGRGTKNEVRAAAEGNVQLWSARHAVTVGRRFVFKAAGKTHLLVPLDLFLMWRDMKESRYCNAAHVNLDEGGVYTLKEGLWGFSKHYVSGKLAGKPDVDVSSEEGHKLKDDMKALWGYTNWLGDFVPGLLRRELPEVMSCGPTASAPTQGTANDESKAKK